jgi:putative membrane protein
LRLSKRCFSFFRWNVFLKGILIGGADLIPGISGGTVAFVCGIYNDLLGNIKKIDFSFFKALIKLDFSYISKSLDFSFLFSLFTGMCLSIFCFSKFIVFCLSNSVYCFYLYSFIFGLMIGTIIYMLGKIKKYNIWFFSFLFLGIFISYFSLKYCCLEKPIEVSFSQKIFDPVLIISASLAICAMLLPGISGSFIFLFFGQYHKVINAISMLMSNMYLDSIFTFINLFIGIILGLMLFSRGILFLLDRYRFNTFSFLVGLIIGSIKIISPVIYYNKLMSESKLNYFFISLFLVFLGVVLFGIIKKNEADKEKIEDITCI